MQLHYHQTLAIAILIPEALQIIANFYGNADKPAIAA